MENPANNNVANNIIDIDLSITNKKKFRIDHDDSRIIELNTSDMGIVGRLSSAYPKLVALQEKSEKITLNVDLEHHEDNLEDTLNDYKTIGDRLAEVDHDMRELIDYIFDSEVSSKAAPTGSMYDLFGGVFRYEHIITTLMELYENNLQEEYEKVQAQMRKHTEKYTNHV